MSSSQVYRVRAVRDRLLSLIHDAAETADLELEVCFKSLPDGTRTLHLEICTRPVVLNTSHSVADALRALEDQTELLIHDLQDFDAQVRKVQAVDVQTGIYLAESEHQIEFASTCETEVEEYLSERPELLIAGPTFLPIPEAEIPKALRRLVVQGVCVPECPKLMA